MKQIFLFLSIGFVFLSSCEKKEQNPSITTLEATAISASSCKAYAQINERGSYTITDYGFAYYYGNSDNSNYINPQNKISLGKELTTDSFSATLPLSSTYNYTGYKWYIWAYITNEKGTVYGKAVSFIPPVISLQSISPSAARSGDTITISGNNFDPIATNNTVQFYYYYNYYTAKVVAVSSTKLKVVVPSFNSSYSDNYCDIRVTTGSQSATLTDVFSLLTSVTGFSPTSGSFGTSITISGSNLNQTSVMFGNFPVSYYSSSNGYINVTIPNNITTKRFKIYVTSGSTKMEVPGGEFVMNSLTATSLTPSKVYAGGNTLTIYGSNFNTSSSYNSVFIGSTKCTSAYSYSSYLTTTIPSSLPSGDYTVKVSNGLDTVVVPGTLKVLSSSLTGISPTIGYWGNDLTISGHNLNTGYTYVYFGSSSYSAYSYDSTTYKIKVPTNLSPGTYKIYLYNGSSQFQSPTDFTILAPTLTSITPANGTIGTAVIITGDGFGTSTSNVSVKFGSINATISAVSNTQINAIVPTGVGGGAWMVTVVVNGYSIPKSLGFSIP